VYLKLLRHYVKFHELALLGYCLMSNHVHLIVVQRRIESLAMALKNTHGRYAAYWNATQQSSGHVWQGRFYSCPLDDFATLIWPTSRI
jgi:putative transposase